MYRKEGVDKYGPWNSKASRTIRVFPIILQIALKYGMRES